MGPAQPPEQAETLDRRPVLGTFCPSRNDRWVFGHRDTGGYLVKFSWTGIDRHILVKGGPSRTTRPWPVLGRSADAATKPPLDPPSRLLSRQDGRCPLCGEYLLADDHAPSSPTSGNNGG